MSNDFDDVNIGGKDGYISLGEILRGNEEEAAALALDEELAHIGDIKLFSNKLTSARHLHTRGAISPDDWRWATHKAIKAISARHPWRLIEKNFISCLLSLGQKYAITRYAKYEKIPYNSALVTVLPNGFRALLEQFIEKEALLTSLSQREKIHAAVRQANRSSHLNAYQRTGIIQSAIHESAIDQHGENGKFQLCSKSMRQILSLSRLYYCIQELKVSSFNDLSKLDFQYNETGATDNQLPNEENSNLKKRKPHHHSLTHYYPYTLRHSLERGMQHVASNLTPPSHTIAINELALSYCGIIAMKNAAMTQK